ncbi:MAG: heavy-metal-associated domain-containing protein [Xanthomonadales bacterium]|nr:heavy-metal-associated domain-containing protein [Xanthomonadales bacterium]
MRSRVTSCLLLLIYCTALLCASSVAQAEQRWVRFRIPGMSCQGCSSQIRNKLKAVPGVHKIHVNRVKEEVKIIYDTDQADEVDMETAIAAAGFLGSVSTRQKN